MTYLRSRDARMEESKDAGGGDFYARVYDAARPELFFKSTPHRVVGHGEPIRIRATRSGTSPSRSSTLAVNPTGHIVGYTIGNDVSSRDIEGENPLYLPQAKVYVGSCALGPARADDARAAAVGHGDSPDDLARRAGRLRRRDDAGADSAAARRNWSSGSSATTSSRAAAS